MRSAGGRGVGFTGACRALWGGGGAIFPVFGSCWGGGEGVRIWPIKKKEIPFALFLTIVVVSYIEGTKIRWY